MSCSGGEASLIADRAEGSGLEFPPFTDEHRAADRADAHRPRHHQQPVRLPHVHVGRSGRDGALLHGSDGRSAGRHRARARRATGARRTTRARGSSRSTRWSTPPRPRGVALSCCRRSPSASPSRCASARSAAGIAPLHGLADGLRALAGAAWSSAQPSSTSMHAPARPIGTTRSLDEATAKGRLAGFGIAVPAGIVVGRPVATSRRRRPRSAIRSR